MPQIKIISVTPHGDVFKTTDRKKRFGINVTYGLANGTTIESVETAEKKKDIPDEIARAQQSAAAGAMAAVFGADGQFWSTSQKWKIDGSKLVPDPIADESEEVTP